MRHIVGSKTLAISNGLYLYLYDDESNEITVENIDNTMLKRTDIEKSLCKDVLNDIDRVIKNNLNLYGSDNIVKLKVTLSENEHAVTHISSRNVFLFFDAKNLITVFDAFGVLQNNEAKRKLLGVKEYCQYSELVDYLKKISNLTISTGKIAYNEITYIDCIVIRDKHYVDTFVKDNTTLSSMKKFNDFCRRVKKHSPYNKEFSTRDELEILNRPIVYKDMVCSVSNYIMLRGNWVVCDLIGYCDRDNKIYALKVDSSEKMLCIFSYDLQTGVENLNEIDANLNSVNEFIEELDLDVYYKR